MTRRIDLDNPPEECRLYAELYERTKLELDAERRRADANLDSYLRVRDEREFADGCVQRAQNDRDAAIAQLATVERELEAWRNCFICLDCGRCKADEDGCCASCGRDCLFFADGKKIFDVDAQEAVVARDTAEKIDYYAGLP